MSRGACNGGCLSLQQWGEQWHGWRKVLIGRRSRATATAYAKVAKWRYCTAVPLNRAGRHGTGTWYAERFADYTLIPLGVQLHVGTREGRNS